MRTLEKYPIKVIESSHILKSNLLYRFIQIKFFMSNGFFIIYPIGYLAFSEIPLTDHNLMFLFSSVLK